MCLQHELPLSSAGEWAGKKFSSSQGWAEITNSEFEYFSFSAFAAAILALASAILAVIYAKRKFVSFAVFQREILLSYFRNFFAYFHIYTSEWQRASLASVALTLRIVINGTFSMNILYNIMQRNIISSTSKPSPDSENRKKENICFRFEK